MQNQSALPEFLQTQLPHALDLLRRMVAINSWTYNSAGVTQLAHFTAECFAPLGFAAEFVPSSNPRYGHHLVLTRRGQSSRSVAMISHLDTVFSPEEEIRNHFHWLIEGDRIYGPGTNDIKGGTVMMWLVLQALRAHAPGVFEETTWKLCLNSSEETYSPDFGGVCRERFNRDTLAALVFESEGRLADELLLIAARKGRVTWRLTVNGRSAHAGSKHAHGANAIVQLAALVPRLAALTDYSRDLTFNVATVAGGTVLNRVPHEAVLEGEFRAFTPEAVAHGKAALLALAGDGEIGSSQDGFRCHAKVELLTESQPWPKNDGSDALVQLWQKAGGELGLAVNTEQRGGLSDGNLLWDAVPTLDGLGPWGDHGHCSERSPCGAKLPEYVLKSSFVPKAALNAMAILKLIEQGGVKT